MYNFNLLRLIKQNVRLSKIRKPKLLAWFAVLLAPLQELYNDFIAYRESISKELSYNCQTYQLERMLNDHFGINYSLDTRDADIAAGTIVWIENTANKLPRNFIYRRSDQNQTSLVIYRRSDNQPPRYIYRRTDYLNNYDFIVKIPAAQIYDEVIVKSLINKYKKATKTYIIQTY